MKACNYVLHAFRACSRTHSHVWVIDSALCEWRSTQALPLSFSKQTASTARHVLVFLWYFLSDCSCVKPLKNVELQTTSMWKKTVDVYRQVSTCRFDPGFVCICGCMYSIIFLRCEHVEPQAKWSNLALGFTLYQPIRRRESDQQRQATSGWFVWNLFES